MSFSIRPGVQKDAQAILDLIVELAVFEKEPNAVTITVEDIVKDGFSENPRFKTFVAEEDDEIIGMALFYERYSTWKGKAIHLEDLMVTQSKRGIGAGKALYTAVLNYAYKNKYKRVAWEVLDWNTAAIDFYKSTGATVYDEWRVCHMNEQSLEQFCNENI
ncbi:GNAT family N-acetyltransferase [Tenacibaculum tangerinum]|uniref:GNAT family N-acetyltransferase n=1 Tax=Tenacibaculum tangerinum TaxID=3038772 RepID=A0ABY8L0K7_9FLAO|nr:GNAT family N-acetyltransferase [Tenacibaculum tangerinum]WGH74824.1 GNAT family N-acetyltransferase [Tenacibaculum tangerinum]